MQDTFVAGDHTSSFAQPAVQTKIWSWSVIRRVYLAITAKLVPTEYCI